MFSLDLILASKHSKFSFNLWHFDTTVSDVYDFRTKDEVSCPDSEYSIKVQFTIEIRFWVH